MFKILFLVSILATIIVGMIEDRVKKKSKEIGDGWITDMMVALSSNTPHMPVININDAKRQKRLHTQEWILWILKGILSIADVVLLGLMLN